LDLRTIIVLQSSQTEAAMEHGSDSDRKYTDLILVDLLHLDYRHFFTRYRVDLLGFIAALALALLIVFGTWLISRIGA